jgi:hypothetical protein
MIRGRERPRRNFAADSLSENGTHSRSDRGSRVSRPPDNRRGSRGLNSGFEIRGVSEELIEKFSQRSHQRDLAIEEFITKNGRQPTDNEVAVLVRETRADKLTAISRESYAEGNGQG